MSVKYSHLLPSADKKSGRKCGTFDYLFTDTFFAVNKGIKSLLSLDRRYIEGNIEEKRKIIGSMYPEKLGFDGLRLRTNRVNEIAMYIYKINSVLSNKKCRTNGAHSTLSGQVARAGFEPTTFGL